MLSTLNAEGLESQQRGMNNRKQLVFCGERERVSERVRERERERERECVCVYTACAHAGGSVSSKCVCVCERVCVCVCTLHVCMLGAVCQKIGD